jgi:hypothetical protein
MAGKELVRISTERFRALLEVCGVSCAAVARATKYSRSYVAQVARGSREYVSREFVVAAGGYFGAVLGETGRVAVGLMVKTEEDESCR